MKTSIRILAGAVVAASAFAVLTATGVSEATPKKLSGSVSVSAAAFADDSGDEHCRVAKGSFASYRLDPDALDQDCDLVAGIQLPDGVTLTALTCSLLDEFAGNAIESDLLRVDLATGEQEYVFTTPGTDDSGLVQVVEDTTATPGTSVVDNAHYAYFVAAAFSNTDFSEIGTAMRLYGCTVDYDH